MMTRELDKSSGLSFVCYYRGTAGSGFITALITIFAVFLFKEYYAEKRRYI
jgi:hypothetical protein